MTRRLALPAMIAAGALTLTGCGFSINDVTLPGGAASKNVFASQQTRTFTVLFTDALDLVPQSSVHVNDVSVGDVQEVTLDQGKARVRLRVLDTVAVPANATGVLRQTSLLGEKFVSLEPPPGVAPSGRLADGAVIPASQTSEELQLEDVFGALSALLNGGGVEQLQTISVELSKALTGRETQLRSLLSELTTFTTTLDNRRAEIVRALDSLDKLSATLVRQRQTISTALDSITPGLRVIDQSRGDIVRLLSSLEKLGTVAVRVENKTRGDTLADLRALQPTLDRLQQAGNDIVGSLQLLVTFPFADNSLKAIFSDYTGLDATLNLDLRGASPANPLGPNGICAALPAGTPVDLCPVTGGVNGVLAPVGGLLGGASAGRAKPPTPATTSRTTRPPTTPSTRPSSRAGSVPAPVRPLPGLPAPTASPPPGTAPLGGIGGGLGQVVGGPVS